MRSVETVHQLTPRDIICITWIAIQYAIRLDQLQRLLYRYTPEPDRYKLKPGVDHLSLDRTYEIINKWLTLGLIEKRIILHGDKLWLWASRDGLRTCRLAFSYSGEPSSVRLPHLFYVNQVRLFVETKRPDDIWKSERQIRKEIPAAMKGQSLSHTPDAIVTNVKNGKITALEIECHAKTDSELEDDLRELVVSYRSIWYFTTKATRRQIESMLEATFTPEMKKPFVIYDLADFGGDYGIS